MPRLVDTFAGKMTKALDNDKSLYDDWRADYYGKTGIIQIYESVKSRKGKYILVFTTFDNIAGSINLSDELRTSYGDLYLDYVDHKLAIVTGNSSYMFENVVFAKERKRL